ncbi:MAG: hypothetical protein NXH70_09715 [Hyphomonas sp.]|nr:hypothetical protein [Hyphomonas sp.]
MLKIKIGWVVFLALFFLGFSAWYGGNGKPITPEEGERLIQELRAFHGSSGSARRGLVDNLAEMIPRDDGKEFYAVNLETLKEGEAARISGETYGSIVMPELFKRGGHPVFDSERVGLMLGEYGNEVDRVIVVRYRSLRDMIDMSMAPAMKEGRVYKYDALDHTEVFITRPTITFVHVRITLALLLLLVGWLGWRCLDWISGRTQNSPG